MPARKDERMNLVGSPRCPGSAAAGEWISVAGGVVSALLLAFALGVALGRHLGPW